MMSNHIYAGAEWIGSVPEHWKFYKGKIIFGESNEKGNDTNLELLSPTQKYGVIPQTLYEQYTTLRTVKVKEDTDLNTFKTVHKGNFCISLRSFQGGFEYSEYEGVVSPAYHILYSKCPICDGYYKYLFKEQSFIAEMNSYCQTLRDGKNISYSDFGKTLIPYPPINEQEHIANYLDDRCSKIDAIIAEAKASIEEYKELKQAVIYEAITKGLDKNVEMKDSGVEWVGKIPNHWIMTKLKYLLESPLQYGANAIGIEYDEKLPRYVRITDISIDGTLKNDNKQSLPLDVSQEYILDIGDVLFARSGGTVGKAFLYNKKDGLCAFAGYLIRAKCKNGVIAKFLYYYTMSSSYNIWKNGIFSQATIQNISAEKYANMPLPLPTELDEIRSIILFIDENASKMDAMISEKQSLIEDLEAYKKSLIYEVVTGKRKVVE